MTAVTKYKVVEERFYSVEDFDNILIVKCFQICFIVFVLLFVCVTSIKILRTCYFHDQLHISGNVIICSMLINEMLNVTQYSVSAGIMLIFGNVWLNEASCKTLAIILQLLRNQQSMLFAIGSTEKLLYCIFPFKHARFFTIRKTIIYILTLYIIVFVLTVLDVLHREVVFVPSMLTCLGTIQNENKSEHSGIVLLRYCFVILPGIWTLWTHIITFIYSIKKRGSLRTDHAIIQQKLFLSFLTLFALLLVDSIGRVWRLLIVNVDGIPPVLGRIGMLYYIFMPAMSNPLIIFLGNQPIRNAIKTKKILPVWLQEIQALHRQGRYIHNRTVHNSDGAKEMHICSVCDNEQDICICSVSENVQSPARGRPFEAEV